MNDKKLKFAFYWAASCGGCEIAVLDINEKILDVVQAAEIVFWPVAIDVKYKDVEAMPDKSIDVCLFNGAIRTEENEEMAILLREKSKILIAYGSCAQLGGIPGLANIASKKEIFEKAYFQTPSTNNPQRLTPQPRVSLSGTELKLPEFCDTVRTLDQTVDVDYYIPGCPPAVERTLEAIEAIVRGELPPKGSVLAPLKSVCDECERKKENKMIARVYRVYETNPDPERCLLEQGILCMGPATRGGCNARCLDANMPCTGCGGPCPNAPEQGAAMLSAVASILGADEEKERFKQEDVEELFRQVKDPIGTFYRYSLPASILKKRVRKE